MPADRYEWTIYYASGAKASGTASGYAAAYARAQEVARDPFRKGRITCIAVRNVRIFAEPDPRGPLLIAGACA